MGCFNCPRHVTHRNRHRRRGSDVLRGEVPHTSFRRTHAFRLPVVVVVVIDGRGRRRDERRSRSQRVPEYWFTFFRRFPLVYDPVPTMCPSPTSPILVGQPTFVKSNRCQRSLDRGCRGQYATDIAEKRNPFDGLGIPMSKTVRAFKCIETRYVELCSKKRAIERNGIKHIIFKF